MRICNKYSSLLIDGKGNIDEKSIRDKVYPWELETFVMMAVRANPEYQNNDFEGENEKYFIRMINGIRNFYPPKLKMYKDNPDLVPLIRASLGMNQFDIQREQYLKFYRARYIYNFQNDKLNLKNRFIEKFGCQYIDFLECCGFLVMIYGGKIPISNKILEYLLNNRFSKASTALTITVDQYKKRLDVISPEVEDYATCLRPSYQFPFIRLKDKIYVPLPHLLIRAGTDSLMYRLTENNEELRRGIGKEVLENYIYKLLTEAGVYDEVYPEQVYYKEKRQEMRTVDVMARFQEEYLFLDSKSIVPTIGMRVFDLTAVENKAQQLAKTIKQIYRQVTIDLPKYNDQYNPFKGKPIIDREHIWAAVVVEDDHHVMQRKIDEQVEAILKVGFKSDEFQWIKQHIKIISLYDIERYSVIQREIITGFKNDFHLDVDSVEYCSQYDEFWNETMDHFMQITDELKQEGLLVEQ